MPTHTQCHDGIAFVPDDLHACVRRGHPVLIIMRGASGSGKSTRAAELVKLREGEGDRGAVVLSTDDYFVVRGRYAFDSSRLEEYHKKNMQRAKDAMEKGTTTIIVDNTNMMIAHLRPYVQLITFFSALKAFYEVYVLEPSTTWKANPRELARRNTHGVDETTIKRALAKYEKIARFTDLLKPNYTLRLEKSLIESDEEDSHVAMPSTSLFLSGHQPPLDPPPGLGWSPPPEQPPLSMSALLSLAPHPPSATSSTISSFDPSAPPFIPGGGGERTMLQTGAEMLDDLITSVSMRTGTPCSSRAPSVNGSTTGGGREGEGTNGTPLGSRPGSALGGGGGREQEGGAPTPLMSLSWTPPPRSRIVARRSMATQHTEAMGILHAIGHSIEDWEDDLCTEDGADEMEYPFEGRPPSKDRETNTRDPVITEPAILCATFPDAHEEDVAHLCSIHGAADAARILLEMGARVDLYPQPEPLTPLREESYSLMPSKRGGGGTRGRGGEGRGGGVRKTAGKSSPSSTESSQGSATTAVDSSEDVRVPSHSSPAAPAGPCLGYDLGEDESVPIALDMTVRQILEIFFQSGAPDEATIPVWMLRLLHRAARGEELTKGAIYYEDFPAAYLNLPDPSDSFRREQEKADEEFARRLHDLDARSSSTSGYTQSQLDDLAALRSMYPTCDGANLAEIFRDNKFKRGPVLDILKLQFGDPAVGSTGFNGIPASVYQPPDLSAMARSAPAARTSTHSSPTRSSRSNPVVGGPRRVVAQLGHSTSANGLEGGSDVAQMQRRNGGKISETDMNAACTELYNRLQEKINEHTELMRSTNRLVVGKTYHGTQFYTERMKKVKREKDAIKEELRDWILEWNQSLDASHLDLHYALPDMAIVLVKTKIDEYLGRGGAKGGGGGGGRSLMIITGLGNNSQDGVSLVRQRVLNYLRQQDAYLTYTQPNEGCFRVSRR